MRVLKDWDTLEKELVKFFNAGLMTIGSATFGLPLPPAALNTGTDLIDLIAQRGETGHIKPVLLGLAEDLRREIANRHIAVATIAHHARRLPEVINDHRPEAAEIRAANETFAVVMPDSSDKARSTVDTLVAPIISAATDSGSLSNLGLDETLSTRMLEILITHILKRQDCLAPLHAAFVEYHSSAQTDHGLSSLKDGAQSHGTKKLWSAVKALERAQQIQAEDMVSNIWAKLQNDKGAAIGMIGERSGDPIKLRQAMDILSAAANIWDKDEAPTSWAETEVNLGNAGWLLGLMENRPELLRTSFRKLEAAHAVYADEGFDDEAQIIHNNLERMLVMIRTEKKIA